MKEMIFIGRQFCEEAVRATKGYRNFYFPTNKKKNFAKGQCRWLSKTSGLYRFIWFL